MSLQDIIKKLPTIPLQLNTFSQRPPPIFPKVIQAFNEPTIQRAKHSGR